MPPKSLYRARLLEFLIKARTRITSGKTINLQELCNQIHIGAQLPTVLIENGLIKRDAVKHNLYHWINGQPVDGDLVEKVSLWSKEYAHKKAALRSEKEKAEQLPLPLTTAWTMKDELDTIHAKLDLIIERFGLK